MIGAPFAHIGGAVMTDHGSITLVEAESLGLFYMREAGLAAVAGAARWADLCAGRATALTAAAKAATCWRRAAGWSDPHAADKARAPSCS